MNDKTRSLGVYLTEKNNPFKFRAFQNWACKIKLKKKVVLEPFAGANDLIKMLQELGYSAKYNSFDIAPLEKSVIARNTIEAFPKNYEVCITNPPWLARNSATRRNLNFPNSIYDDLYKHCLNLCLKNCQWIAALIPASFLQSKLFRERLDTVIFIQEKLFIQTESPVCLALFSESTTENTFIYKNNQLIGELKQLEKYIPVAKKPHPIKFNATDGNLGLIGIDNTKKASIRFCEGQELDNYPIKISSRAITRIRGNFKVTNSFIANLNNQLNKFRENTKDIFLTTFKGLRADGNYRRRLDFATARGIINSL